MRGVSVNDAGDIQDAATEVTGGIPAILAETSRIVMDPATQTPRTIRAATCKVPYWVQVDDTDQIKNQVTGDIYAIISITRPPVLTSMPIGGPPDTLLTLKHISATTV